MRRGSLIASILAWIAVWVFWLLLTHNSHPSWTLAIIVTTTLVVAYAFVVYVHHLVLIPRYLSKSDYPSYLVRLIPSMLIMNGLALGFIRVSYFELAGPDADPYGAYKHYAIDLFGMIVHLGFGALAVWIWRKLRHGADKNASGIA